MQILDAFPLWAILVVAILGQVVFIELGFRVGTFRQGKPNKAQMAQVRAIMGASLGLLAFMLAFSFNTAQQHFEERARAYMLEISAIDTAFRGTDLLPPAEAGAAKKLLQQFAQLRIQTSEASKASDRTIVIAMIRESERLHDQLWAIAEASMDYNADGIDSGIFAQAVLAMIDAHDARLQAALFNRISPIIWITLYLMSVLSMTVMGYQAGLTGTRSTLATWTLAATFAAVMVLITDLDRPRMSLFKLNQQLMVEMASRMDGGEYWDMEVHKDK